MLPLYFLGGAPTPSPSTTAATSRSATRRGKQNANSEITVIDMALLGNKRGGGGAGHGRGAGSKASMKYRSFTEGPPGAGTRPLAEAPSVSHVLAMMVVHLARRVLYGVEVKHRAAAYVVGVLVLSVVGDFSSTIGKNSYMARADNVFNVWFVKFGWAWTSLAVAAFSYLAAYVVGCGHSMSVQGPSIRLSLATLAWWSATMAFEALEASSAVCSSGPRVASKGACELAGGRWRGLDVSGHAFILVFCSLFVVEEGKAYLGWERVKDWIRDEDHRRLSADVAALGGPEASTAARNALSTLPTSEFLTLRSRYSTFTSAIRVLFCLLALLTLLWDVMLVCTALYFHIMVEKVTACCCAVVLWFFLYRMIYVGPLSPGLPGEGGPFKYVMVPKRVVRTACKKHNCGGGGGGGGEHQRGRNESRWTAKDDLPKFMGMPLYGLNQKEDLPTEVQSSPPDAVVRPLGGRRRPRSSSNSTARLNAASSSTFGSKYF